LSNGLEGTRKTLNFFATRNGWTLDFAPAEDRLLGQFVLCVNILADSGYKFTNAASALPGGTLTDLRNSGRELRDFVGHSNSKLDLFVAHPRVYLLVRKLAVALKLVDNQDRR
jgi:hypothetical protein